MSEFLPINQWPAGDRPREKLITRGPESLSDSELIAILIGTGSQNNSALDIARQILNDYGTLFKFGRAKFIELVEKKGIGEAKAITILAALELGKRVSMSPPDKMVTIKGPEEVFQYFGYRYSDYSHEVFSVLLLDTANQVLSHHPISSGTLNQSLAHPREVFKPAIDQKANSVILMHNHPSGNPTPSQEDIRLTEKMIESGKILGISVLDHVVIGGKNYTSLAQMGYFDGK